MSTRCSPWSCDEGSNPECRRPRICTGTYVDVDLEPYRYLPTGGALGRLAGPLTNRMLTATFMDVLVATDEVAFRSGDVR
jgi:hypothetical protein